MPINLNNLNNFKIENNRVVLTSRYLESQRWLFKKITGTRFGSIVNLNKYNTPFKTWMGMVNLYKDVIDPTLARTGNIIEPKIRDYVCKQLSINFQVYDPKAINWDVFKENKIFGGIPDGEPIDIAGNIDYSNDLPMLEIKTSSIDTLFYKSEHNELKMVKNSDGLPVVKEKNGKRNSWFQNGQINISNEYCMQLGLYLYLRNTTKGVFAIGFLEPKDYANPESFDPYKHEIQIAYLEMNRNMMAQYIEYATHWYHDHIDTGISPAMTEADQKWLKIEIERISK
ncbi:MAG: YqaJ viral recombinase family protein [Mycoplasmataceae bacterium]|nr:YqaJ viral recombinase family protein [Mycoplasmataceae bacterium]